MRIDRFQASAIRGLYGFVAYPIRVTTQTQGVYTPGVGQSAGTCDMQVYAGLISKWQRRELSGTNVPFTAAKLVLLRCEQLDLNDDLACATCFEPTCGAYAGSKFRIWKGPNDPHIERDVNNTMLTFAVVETPNPN